MLKVLLASIFAFLFTRGCERVILSDDDLFGGFVGMLGTNRFSRHDILAYFLLHGRRMRRTARIRQKQKRKNYNNYTP